MNQYYPVDRLNAYGTQNAAVAKNLSRCLSILHLFADICSQRLSMTWSTSWYGCSPWCWNHSTLILLYFYARSRTSTTFIVSRFCFMAALQLLLLPCSYTLFLSRLLSRGVHPAGPDGHQRWLWDGGRPSLPGLAVGHLPRDRPPLCLLGHVPGPAGEGGLWDRGHLGGHGGGHR